MRHEEKFLCSKRQLYLIENRIKNFLDLDASQLCDGYSIRSIYFDTETDRFYEESLQGLQIRDKYRIRIYNQSDSVIKLEKKSTVNQLKKKSTSFLTREIVDRILENKEWHHLYPLSDDTVSDFWRLQRTEMLLPKIVVEYVRKAYVNDVGNVRITMDSDLKASWEAESFFAPDMLKIPILPEDKGILEVKYDGIFPGYLAKIMNLGVLQQISFSKYVLCKNFIINNGREEEGYEF